MLLSEPQAEKMTGGGRQTDLTLSLWLLSATLSVSGIMPLTYRALYFSFAFTNKGIFSTIFNTHTVYGMEKLKWSM